MHANYFQLNNISRNYTVHSQRKNHQDEFTELIIVKNFNYSK
jgi:hypothetical protein